MTYMLGSFKLLTCVRASLSVILLAIILAISSDPVAAQTPRTLRIVNTSIERGTNGTVAIEMDCVGDENTFGFSVTFDQSRLTFVSAALGGGVPTGTVLLPPNEQQKQNGRVGLAISLPFGAAITAGTRQLVVLTFAAGTTGASAVTVGFGDQPIPREFVKPTAEAIPNSTVTFSQGTVTLYGVGTTVSAASFKPASPVAPQSIVAVFGHNFATGIDVGGTIPLPTTLLGTTIKVKDSGNAERLSQLFFVSPDQCNYEIPAGTAIGPASITVTSGNASISLGTVNIAAISPGIFCANANGSGVAAAQIYRLRGNDLTIEPVATYSTGAAAFVPNPIDMGPEGDVLVLVLYGTGIRGVTATSNVAVNIGGTAVPVAYAGVAPGFVGLDQINTVALPRSFAGRGLVNVNVTVDGVAANTVTVQFK